MVYLTRMPRSFSSWARIGPQRRVISGADSVDRRAKVISAGQLASFARADPAGRTSAISQREEQQRAHASHGGPPHGVGVVRVQIASRRMRDGQDVDAHHHGDDQQEHGGRLPVVEGADRVPQVEADAAAADHPDDGRGADVGLEAQQHVGEEVRQHLGHDAEADDVQPPGPDGGDPLHLAGIDGLDGLAQQLAEDARRCGRRAPACPAKGPRPTAVTNIRANTNSLTARRTSMIRRAAW